MYEVTVGHVKGTNGIPVSYSYLQADSSSDTLVMLLPGYGYTNDSPMFRYTTGLCLENGLNVLEINYNYRDERYDSVDVFKVVVEDVRLVIDQVLHNYSVQQYIVVGKSLGTIAMASELTRNVFHDAKLIWLTPLLKQDDIYEAIQSHKGQQIVLMGTADQHYVLERIEHLEHLALTELEIVEQMNHSLEYTGNTYESLRLLETLLKRVEQFMISS
ncbi:MULTISPECIES: alpha/beta family hydrolase [unclassified Exiguobacterium]|uniref:alpha/beta family hydrolase n=1 Tax=unclassified Exiguobacterium TaxID=2644629 RepID=UPI001BE62823|nr:MULTISPECIES: alpha/beta family hydrolase [unclassified Exiguobacterium]